METLDTFYVKRVNNNYTHLRISIYNDGGGFYLAAVPVLWDGIAEKYNGRNRYLKRINKYPPSDKRHLKLYKEVIQQFLDKAGVHYSDINSFF